MKLSVSVRAFNRKLFTVTFIRTLERHARANTGTVVENTAEVVRSLGSGLQTRSKCPLFPQLVKTPFLAGHLIEGGSRFHRSNTWFWPLTLPPTVRYCLGCSRGKCLSVDLERPVVEPVYGNGVASSEQAIFWIVCKSNDFFREDAAVHRQSALSMKASRMASF